MPDVLNPLDSAGTSLPFVQALKTSQGVLARPAPITVPGVFATMRQIADEKGKGGCSPARPLLMPLACLLARLLT
jgi:hypothetical protein